MLTVTVNDRPLDVAAIVERKRVLLPMRATFTALGASVRYDPRGHIIVARSASHSLRLPIGERTAVVDGRRVTLDVPARVIAARTYVPVRFVAQAMGAVVGYDAASRLVSVMANGTYAGASDASAANASVVAITPVPRSVADTAYPTISASLGSMTASRTGVTLLVDGQDVTPLASFDGTTITYMPRIGLTLGQHTVTFSGRTAAGAAFSSTWTFETAHPPAPDGPALSDYNFRFYTNGSTLFYPGDWMHFSLIAPPGGSAQLQLCGLGYQYGLSNTAYGTLYEANFPAPYGYWLPACTVTAVYTAWNGKQYFVPIPIVIGLYTGSRPNAPSPSPSPRATPSPRPIPSAPRHAEPTRAPSPAPHPRVPTPRPRVPTPHPMPPRIPPHPPRPHPTP